MSFALNASYAEFKWNLPLVLVFLDAQINFSSKLPVGLPVSRSRPTLLCFQNVTSENIEGFLLCLLSSSVISIIQSFHIAQEVAFSTIGQPVRCIFDQSTIAPLDGKNHSATAHLVFAYFKTPAVPVHARDGPPTDAVATAQCRCARTTYWAEYQGQVLL